VPRDGKHRSRKPVRNQTGQETDMNVRSITSFILAAVLMTLTGGVSAVEQGGQVNPYTGPDTPVMTST
jgi:hypothetical protein